MVDRNKKNKNTIVVTTKYIEDDMSYDEYFESVVEVVNSTAGRKVVKRENVRINGSKYDFVQLNEGELVRYAFEANSEEFINTHGQEKYDEEYREIVESKMGTGSTLFMRELENKRILNIELNHITEKGRLELMKIIRGIYPLL